MYIEIDRITPSILAFTNGLKTRNTFLRHFPRALDDGIEVFGRLTYWHMDTGVNKSASALKLYALLNIKVSDLDAADYGDAESAWIRLKPEPLPYDMPVTLLADRIAAETSLDAYYSTSIRYEPMTLDIPYALSDAQIISMALAGHYDITFNADYAPEFLGLALLDTNETIFERIITIDKKSVVVAIREQDVIEGSSANYIYSMTLKVVFRRISDPTVEPATSFLNIVKTRFDALDVILTAGTSTGVILVDGEYAEATTHTSINKQLYLTYAHLVPWSDSVLTTVNGFVKTAGMSSITSQNFSQLLIRMLDTGIQPQSADTLTRILSVVIIFVAFILAVWSGGIAAVGLPGLYAALAFSAAAGAVLGVAMLAQAALMYYYSSKGQTANAMIIAGTMQILGYVSMVFSIISLYGTWASAWATAAATVAKETAKQSAIQTAYNTVKILVVGAIKESTSNLMMSMIKFMSVGFDMYKKYIDPTFKDLEELRNEVAASEKELEDYSSPDSLQKAQFVFESKHSNIYDMNEYMQTIPWLMTEGKIVSSMTKYYS